MKLDSRAWIALVVVTLFVIFVFKMFENQKMKNTSETNQSSTEKPSGKSPEKKQDSRSISSIAPPAAQTTVLTQTQNPVSTESVPPTALSNELTRNLKEKTGLSAWKVDGATQTVTISGEIFKFPIGAITDRLQWGRFLAEQIGIRPDQIVDIGSKQQDSSFSKSYELNQSFQGYLVEGSFIRIHERKEDGFVYYSSMSLQDIGHPDLEIKVSLKEAEDLLKHRYPAGTVVSVLKAAQAPLVFTVQPGRSELAWQIEIKLTGAVADSREIMISAKTGTVLREVPTLMF